MSERGKKHGAGGSHGLHEQAARAAVQKDPQSARLLGAGKALGNDELQQRLQRGKAGRDEMLALIVERLGAMREAQSREITSGSKEAMRLDGTARVADGSQAAEIDPKKWHLPARTYEEAAYQLSRGAVHQGAQLVERAIREERSALEEMPAHIKKDDLDLGMSAPTAVTGASPTQAATPCELPAALQHLVDDILAANGDEVESMVRRRGRDPWWTEDEEEEEEKPDGKSGGQ